MRSRGCEPRSGCPGRRRRRGRNRFFKGLSSWIGFRQVRVDYAPAARAFGATSWNVASLIGLSIEGLTSFTVAPLRVASLLGILLAVAALIETYVSTGATR